MAVNLIITKVSQFILPLTNPIVHHSQSLLTDNSLGTHCPQVA